MNLKEHKHAIAIAAVIVVLAAIIALALLGEGGQ